MRNWICAAWLLAASAAQASETPIYAPAPAWVQPAGIPAAAPIKEDKLLLLDWQERLSGSGDEYYIRTAHLVRTQGGLDEAGKVTFHWNPDTDELIVHKIAIHRGGTIIDLLAGGQKLTVLRRETDLEQSMLNGWLTGALMAEGLEVGDVLETAYTVRRNDPVFAGRSASVMSGATAPAAKTLLRQIWKTAEPYKWRVSRDMPAPRIRVSGDTTELSLELANAEPRQVPGDAPRRFHEIGTVETSSFASWQEVSRLMAPHYARASALADDSPLRAEAKRILADHATAAGRTRAALALVQERMRYVYLGMEAGGYVPAPADQSWSRRFGDCKAKTAVLLALLNELGIPARPALVSSYAGDGLSARLPSPLAFDHVIVRAEVDGRTYWLDGTANDAGTLDRVEAGDFRWALPLSAEGTALEQLPAALPRMPTLSAEIEVDARNGTTLAVPMKLTASLSGRAAAQMRAAMDSIAADKRRDMLQAMFSTQDKGLTVKDVATGFDAAAGTYSITLTGTALLQWQQLEKGRRYLIDGLDAPKLPQFGRKDGPDKDLPMVVPPVWFTGRTTILLPDGGNGFSVAGTDLDRKVGGMTISRKARIEGGRMIVDHELRAVQPEIEAAEARNALGTFTDLSRSRLYLVASDYSIGEAERTVIAADQPKTVDALLDRGNEFINRGEYALAIADMDAILRMEPGHARAMANRGIARYWLNDFAGAGADFDAAAQRDPKEVVWMRGRGLLALRRADYPKAVAAFSEALALDPADRFSLYRRGEALERLGKVDGALTDIDALLKLGEDPINLNRWRANALIYAGRPAEALASLDKLVSDYPTDPAVRLLRASALAAADRDAEAVREYDALIGMKPSIGAYLGRARLLEEKNPAAALADADAALTLDPDSASALEYRAERLIAAKQVDKALAPLDAAVARKPADLGLRMARATARVKAGVPAQAIADIVEAKKLAATSDELNELCWWGATEDQALELALAACDEALAKQPHAASIHDSRALVLLRLNRLDDALAAYDRALSLAPDLPASLYGRSLVKARLNDPNGSKADREAAIAADKHVEQEFEDFRIPTYRQAGANSSSR